MELDGFLTEQGVRAAPSGDMRGVMAAAWGTWGCWGGGRAGMGDLCCSKARDGAVSRAAKD